MSNDQDPKKRRAWMSDTQRNLEGVKASKERARSQAERRDQLDDLAAAVAVDKPEPEDGLDFDDVDTDMNAISEETRERIESDPLLQLVFAKLASERKRRANQVSAAMGAKPPAEELRTLKRRVNILWAAAMFTLTAAGGSLIAVAKWLKESGKDDLQKQLLIEHDNDQERRLQQVESLLRSNNQRIEDHLMFHGRSRGSLNFPMPDTPAALTPDPSPPKLKP